MQKENENRRIKQLRNALNAVDDKTEAVNRPLDEVERLREDIRAVTLEKEGLLRAGMERVEMEEKNDDGDGGHPPRLQGERRSCEKGNPAGQGHNSG
jgi:hypothetical protein